MKQSFIGILVIMIITMVQLTHAAGVTTPVQYCASLAATSCEVLNWEYSMAANSGGNYGTLLIKYCRNQKAGAVVLGVNYNGNFPSVTTALPIYKHGLSLYVGSLGTQTAITALDSASLCAAMISVDGGSSSLLP